MDNEYTPNALRTLANLDQDYIHWMDACRQLAAGRLAWKTRGEADYLYRIRGAVETSLGRRSPKTEQLHEAYEHAVSVKKNTENRLRMNAALCKTQRLPTMSAFGGEVLRALDLQGEVGDDGVMVVGTNALLAYEQLAQRALDQSLMETMDFDLAWRRTKPYSGRPVVDALKKADQTWTINQERPFQLLNAKGEEVELLVAPSRLENFPMNGLRPVDIPEQDWLLLGIPVEQVVPCQNRHAARVVAPDPRYFALHKLFMSESPKRNALKKKKDFAQGEAVLELVMSSLPEYPMDADFVDSLPPPLREVFDQWQSRAALAETPPLSSHRLRPFS